MLLLLGFMIFSPVTALFAAEPDPAGTKTGGAADVVGASANAPTADDLKNLATNEPLAAKLADVVGHNRICDQFCVDSCLRFSCHVHAGRICNV